jgi:RNA polymerase sigma-70 factor, ECF subfamily
MMGYRRSDLSRSPSPGVRLPSATLWRWLAAVGPDHPDDPWEELLDTSAAYSALSRLPGPQRAALALRYLDGLSVAEIADHLDRTVKGTETLLVRARAALRRVYREEAA